MTGHLHSHDIAILEHRARIHRHDQLARRTAPRTPVLDTSRGAANRRSRLSRRRAR